jgi:hypothetical protein
MSLFKKQKLKSKNRKKFTGLFLIVSGILLVALFYYQSMDGAVNTGPRFGQKRIVTESENPRVFRNVMYVNYGLGIACVMIGILKLRK